MTDIVGMYQAKYQELPRFAQFCEQARQSSMAHSDFRPQTIPAYPLDLTAQAQGNASLSIFQACQ